MSSQAKILVVGPPCGRIKELAGKVKAIHDKHGPFEALFCLGDLFEPSSEAQQDEFSQEEVDLLEGRITLPMPIYFAFSTTPLPPRIRKAVLEGWAQREDDKPVMVASQIYFLGKTAVCSLPSGLRIAVAGGLWDASEYSESSRKEESELDDFQNPFITASSINRLLSNTSFRQTEAVKVGPEEDEPPQTLAAARAQMAARAEALQQQADKQEAQRSKPSVDLLLTTTWPTGITMFSNPDKLPHPTSRVWGAPPIAQLLRACQPRYHFSLAPGSCGLPTVDDSVPMGIAGLDSTEDGKDLRLTGCFWEREPYRNDQPAPSHPLCSTTRFISLARLANAKKQRWFMALNLVPASMSNPEEARKAVTKNTAGATLSPFSTGGYGGGGPSSLEVKRKASEMPGEAMESGPNFRWSGDPTRGKRAKRAGANGLPSRPDGPLPDGPREKRPVAIPVGPNDCWFCLSNPQCAKHLIIAIGTECYVAMPKGQLPPTSDPLSPVPGGGHVLIIPIEHFPSLLGHADPEQARPIAQEMDVWRQALRKSYASFAAIPFSWEVCKTVGTRAGHMQAQVVPIPKAMIGGIQDYFREAAQKREYNFIEDGEQVADFLRLSDDATTRSERRDYVRLDFDDQTWIMPLNDRRFYLQFPRETLANFLNVPDRADWKKCARSEAIETAEAKAFKASFEDFSKDVE